MYNIFDAKYSIKKLVHLCKISTGVDFVGNLRIIVLELGPGSIPQTLFKDGRRIGVLNKDNYHIVQ